MIRYVIKNKKGKYFRGLSSYPIEHTKSLGLLPFFDQDLDYAKFYTKEETVNRIYNKLKNDYGEDCKVVKVELKEVEDEN